jgi:hypothetical protein
MNGRRVRRCTGLGAPGAMKPSHFAMPVLIYMRPKRKMFALVALLLGNVDIVITRRVH